jgi:hypothetical protein
MGRHPVSGEEGAHGTAFGSHRGDDRRRARGGVRLTVALNYDLVQWLEVGEG